MTLKDAIGKAIEIIGEDIDLETENTKRTRLIACGNMIYHELITQYLDMIKKENLVFVDNKVYFSEFSEKVKDILEVYFCGKNVPFKVYPLYIESGINGETEIIYSYYTNELEINDEMILPPKYTLLFLANGIASEYYYRTGMTDEALVYKNRYDTALLNLSRKRKGIILNRTGRIGCKVI